MAREPMLMMTHMILSLFLLPKTHSLFFLLHVWMNGRIDRLGIQARPCPLEIVHPVMCVEERSTWAADRFL